MGNSKISPANGPLINVLEGIRRLLSLVTGSNRAATCRSSESDWSRRGMVFPKPRGGGGGILGVGIDVRGGGGGGRWNSGS